MEAVTEGLRFNRAALYLIEKEKGKEACSLIIIPLIIVI
jgi:hypothetical protein